MALGLVGLRVDSAAAAAKLLAGEIVVMGGSSGEAMIIQGRNPAIEFVLPEEGAILWGDSFVASARNARKATAEQFVGSMLRRENGALIAKTCQHAVAIKAACALITTELSNSRVLRPPPEVLEAAEWSLPLSAEGQKRWDEPGEHGQAAHGAQS